MEQKGEAVSVQTRKGVRTRLDPVRAGDPEPGLLHQAQLNGDRESAGLGGDTNRSCIGCDCFCLDKEQLAHSCSGWGSEYSSLNSPKSWADGIKWNAHVFHTFGELPTCQSAHLHCSRYLHSTRKTETWSVYRSIPCPPGTYLTPDHQLNSIVPWWYTCRKVTCSCFLRRIKKTWKKPDKGKSWVDVFRQKILH